MNDGVKLTCAKNGTVMKLFLTSENKTSLIRRYWSLYNNNATGSKSLEWINNDDGSSEPYCASVWTNRKRLRRGLRNALDLKHGKVDYESEKEEESINKKIDTKLEEWINSIGKEEYIRFSSLTYEAPKLKEKGCDFAKIRRQESGGSE